MVVNFYLKRDPDSVSKFYVKIFSYFEISTSFFYVPPSNKHRTLTSKLAPGEFNRGNLVNAVRKSYIFELGK